MAHDTHAMRKHNKQLSSREAAEDLTNFYDKVPLKPLIFLELKTSIRQSKPFPGLLAWESFMVCG